MRKLQTYSILTLILLTMESFVGIKLASNPQGFIAYMGFAAGKSGTLLSWSLAAFIVWFYCWGAASIAEVREHMFKLSPLKGLSIIKLYRDYCCASPWIPE